MTTLRRELHPETRILDATKGLVEYVASDETLDAYREVIRADGWRFDYFKRNAPFVDSHHYGSIEQCVGRVVDFKVEGQRLVETVQWAIDVPDNKLAQLGFKMTEAGYLKAVSVGFFPTRWVSRHDRDPAAWRAESAKLGFTDETAAPRCIYLEQQQVELSTVLIGANPNALAKAYKAGLLDDALLESIFQEQTHRETAEAPALPDHDAPATNDRARLRFLAKLQLATH